MYEKIILFGRSIIFFITTTNVSVSTKFFFLEALGEKKLWPQEEGSQIIIIIVI